LQKLVTIDQREVPSFGKLAGVFCELPGGDDKSTGCTLGCHDAVQLTDHIDPHFERFPLLALNKKSFFAFDED
jgi:hypothetical protein